MTRPHAGWAFDELTVGQVFASSPHLVTGEEISAFARLLGESNPLHFDEAFGAQSAFGSLVASGSFGLALTIALIDQTQAFHGTAVAALGIEHWSYLAPVSAGMEVRSRMTISGLRARTKDRSSGVVTRSFELIDESGRTVQIGDSAIIVATRAAAGRWR